MARLVRFREASVRAASCLEPRRCGEYAQAELIMSRPTRAGSAGRNVTIRATDAERRAWRQLAGLSGESLSEWIRVQLNRHVVAFETRFAVKLKRKPAVMRARSGR